VANKSKEEPSVQTPNPNIEKLISSIQTSFNKEFGQSSMGRLDDDDNLSKITDWVSTGSDVIDYVLLGGRPKGSSLVPLGRQMSIEGLEGCGKTSACAQIAANVQRNGGIVVVVDAEDRVDQPYWSTLGVDVKRVLSIRENKIEDVFRKQIKLIDILKKTAPDQKVLFIWDSIGSSSVVVDPDEDVMSDASYGKEAKVLARGLKVINSEIAKSKVGYIYTNHLYQKMGVTYGDKWETSGGQKLKYFATVRIRLTKIGQITEQDEFDNKVVIGDKVLVKAVKNSMAPKLLEMEAAVIGGKGYCNEWTVKERAEDKKLITKAGAWSTCLMSGGDEIKFQGFNGFLEKVVPHEDYAALKAECWR
jgi:recombination protein RecA